MGETGPHPRGLDIPDPIKRLWSPYQKIFERYGKVIYAAFTPTADLEGTAPAVTELRDVMFEERGRRNVGTDGTLSTFSPPAIMLPDKLPWNQEACAALAFGYYLRRRFRTGGASASSIRTVL